MIDNNLIQAALISKLKADTNLIAFLAQYNASDEIREASYQGTVFAYPNVRIELGTQIETGEPPCYSEIPFTVYCHSEENSSKQANELAGFVNDALIRKNFSGTGFTSGRIITDGTISARRTTERIWQAVCQFRCNIYGGDFD